MPCAKRLNLRPRAGPPNRRGLDSGRGRSLRIVANDVLLAETDEGGLMAVADGLEFRPIRVRRLQSGSPRSVDLVEHIHPIPAGGEAR